MTTMLRTFAARGARVATQWQLQTARTFHNYGAVFNAPTRQRGKQQEHFPQQALAQLDRVTREDRIVQRFAKHRYYVKGTQRKYRVAQANRRRASMRAITRDISRINESFEAPE